MTLMWEVEALGHIQSNLDPNTVHWLIRSDRKEWRSLDYGAEIAEKEVEIMPKTRQVHPWRTSYRREGEKICKE